MNAVTAEKMQPRLSMSVETAGLKPGRAYRLEITGYVPEDRFTPPFSQIRIVWEGANEGGDEYFPFPRKDDTWHAPIQWGPRGGYTEFRAPDEGTIHFIAIPGEGITQGTTRRALRIKPISPAIPTRMLRQISGIRAVAQERCSLLDLQRWTRSLVPLPGPGHTQQREGTQAGGQTRPAVAFIGSRELLEEIAFDCDAVPVDEKNWAETLCRGRFDYLLIDPVLHVDQTSWRYAMIRSGDTGPMRELLRHCREITLPVVLWLRVEMELYEEFSWLVPFSDHVYAIDPTIQRMVEAQHPETQAQVLPACIQPRLHNPICDRKTAGLRAEFADKVLLDGWWQLAAATKDNLLDELRRERLLVSESEWEFSFTRLNTLPRFRWNTIGCLDQPGKALLSRLTGAELVLPDETIPGWRREQMMLRSAASGSLVLFRNEGLKSSLIDTGLCWHGDDEMLIGALPAVVDNTLERARWRHRVAREALEHHTYATSLARISRDLGLGHEPARPPKVACLLVSMRPWLLDGCIERFRRDLYPEKELIIVVHGSPATARELAARSSGDPRIQVHQMGKARSLGACLNYAAQQTDAPFWAKVDDDDLYGPRYLSDMMLYQRIADSDLLAKPPAFTYLEDRDELLWDAQRASRSWMRHPAGGSEATTGIAGGTLVGKRSLLQEIPFSELRRGGSDSDFALRARNAGHDLLVTDPFNFVFFRSARAGFHTWSTNPGKLREKSVKVGTAASLDATAFV